MDNEKDDEVEDRLSNLPEALLISILSTLPTKQAVSTSILSKRYRYLWHFITQLQLLDQNIFPTSDDDDRSAAQIWHTMLDSIELYVHGPIHSCTISFNPSYAYIPRLRTFLHFLILKGIKVLKIVNRGIGCYELPSIQCQTLEKLELGKCLLSNVNEFINIRSLVLFRVYLTNKQFESLVSNCVALESLKVDCCVRVRHFKIRAPKLVWLEICSLKRIRISLMDVGCLKEASFRFQYEFEDMYLRYCDDSSKEEDDDQGKKLVRLFMDLSRSRAEVLSFSFCTEFIECLQRQRAEIPPSLAGQYQLQAVKKLDIETSLGNLQMATIISCILHSCPNLEQLFLQDKEHQNTAGNYWETQQSHPCVCLMNSLKIIQISRVNLHKSCCWVGLVGYLVMNARMCKRITVQYNDDGDDHVDRSLILEQRLNMLQWANPDAVLELVPLFLK